MAKVSPLQFFRQVKQEVKKVTWPTWDKLQSSALLVMVATVIFAVVIFAMDFAFRHLMTFIYTM